MGFHDSGGSSLERKIPQVLRRAAVASQEVHIDRTGQLWQVLKLPVLTAEHVIKRGSQSWLAYRLGSKPYRNGDPNKRILRAQRTTQRQASEDYETQTVSPERAKWITRRVDVNFSQPAMGWLREVTRACNRSSLCTQDGSGTGNASMTAPSLASGGQTRR